MKKLPRFGLVLLLIAGLWLGFVRATCWAEPNPSPDDPATLRHEIRNILSDSHFTYLSPWIWVDRVVEAIKDFLNLFPKPHSTVPSPGMVTVLKWLALLIVLTIPYWFYRFGWHLLWREARLKRTPSIALPQPVTAENLETQATAQAQKQEFREAVRLVYLAALTRFKEHGILTQTTTRPDRENLSTIKRIWGTQHPGGLAFTDLVRLFQEKWYGLKSCNHLDYQKSRELAQLIRAQLKDAHH